MPELSDDDGRIELSVPARPESLELVHPALEQLWSTHDAVPARVRVRFETAVVEIFANIVEHAFRSDPEVPADEGRRLDLVLTAGPDAVRAGFVDNGRPAELDLSAVTMPDADAESGRGLAMAMAAVDEVSYERAGARNRWQLMCLLGDA